MERVLCREESDGGGGVMNTFSITRMADGRIKVQWQTVGHTYDSLEELAEAGVLNAHERELLRRGVGSA